MDAAGAASPKILGCVSHSDLLIQSKQCFGSQRHQTMPAVAARVMMALNSAWHSVAHPGRSEDVFAHRSLPQIPRPVRALQDGLADYLVVLVRDLEPEWAPSGPEQGR